MFFRPAGGGSVDGSGIILPGQAQGDIMYHDGAAWVVLPKGTALDVLTQGATIPAWAAPAAPASFLGYPKMVATWADTTLVASGMSQNDLGDIYLTHDTNGHIFKQTGGAGNFVDFFTPAGGVYGYRLTSLGNNTYFITTTTDIHMQTAGVGNFNALSQTSRSWRGICNDGTHAYACVTGGGIYKQTNGTGNFVAMASVTNRSWLGVACLGDHLYACTGGGGGKIYRMENKTGDPVDALMTGRDTPNGWYLITADTVNGDLYAVDVDGKLYISSGGIDTMVEGPYGFRNWEDITFNATHNRFNASEKVTGKSVVLKLEFN